MSVACHERALRLPRGRRKESRVERETGFEPATSTLARSHSTTELFPLAANNLLYQMGYGRGKIRAGFRRV